MLLSACVKLKIAFSKSDERGLSLLEYAVGAAVLTGIVYAAMTALGGGMENYFSDLSKWMTDLNSELPTTGSN